mmetsp:Transcript_133252/g.231128  ORF Transcript_133252/g.231128 Transcript_133252/m.231128 type:complete len:83 (-) Transcript_133252:9-257(-)
MKNVRLSAVLTGGPGTMYGRGLQGKPAVERMWHQQQPLTKLHNQQPMFGVYLCAYIALSQRVRGRSSFTHLPAWARGFVVPT